MITESDISGHPGILAADLMNSFFAPGACGFNLSDHRDGYRIYGSHDFQSYIGSPERSPSLEAFAAECERVWQEYREHLWKRLQETV